MYSCFFSEVPSRSDSLFVEAGQECLRNRVHSDAGREELVGDYRIRTETRRRIGQRRRCLLRHSCRFYQNSLRDELIGSLKKTVYSDHICSDSSDFVSVCGFVQFGSSYRSFSICYCRHIGTSGSQAVQTNGRISLIFKPNIASF